MLANLCVAQLSAHRDDETRQAREAALLRPFRTLVDTFLAAIDGDDALRPRLVAAVTPEGG